MDTSTRIPAKIGLEARARPGSFFAAFAISTNAENALRGHALKSSTQQLMHPPIFHEIFVALASADARRGRLHSRQ